MKRMLSKKRIFEAITASHVAKMRRTSRKNGRTWNHRSDTLTKCGFCAIIVSHMRRILIAVLITLFSSTFVMGQAKEANPADVGSMDSIIKAVYAVISGDAGKPRDWDRFRSLFHPDARLIPSNKNAQTGLVGARALSPEDYVKR